MDTKTLLYISYAVIGLSLCALAFSVLTAVLRVPVPAGASGFVRMLSVVWPLAFYAAAVYRRKLAQDAKKLNAKP